MVSVSKHRLHIFAGLVCFSAPLAYAQGVPTFDAGMFLQRERVLQQGEQDLALQRNRLTKEEELEELEQEQLQALEDILNAATLASGNSGALVASLEAGSSPESTAETL